MEQKKKKTTTKKTISKKEIKKVEDNKKEIKKDEDEDKKRRILIIILLILLLFFLFIFRVDDIVLGTPTKPVLTKTSDGWSTTNVVEIEEDSNARNKVDYYLYCIVGEKDPSKCVWKKTKTKNVVVDKEGTNYVYFKAVDKNGKEGKISDPVEVRIDTTGPDILKVNKKATTNSIEVEVEAEDKGSGIDKYFFKLDDGEFIESNKNTYTFKDLEPNKEYTITVKVVDKAGNIKEVTFKVKTDSNGNVIDENNDETNQEKSTDNKDKKDSGKEESTKEETEEVEEIPEISLSKIPNSFTIGESYKIPSSYKFGKSGGKVVCYLDGEEGLTDTKDILY